MNLSSNLLSFSILFREISEMADRHKLLRQYASGANKRKSAAEKQKKVDETIQKTRKIDSFFTQHDKQEESDVTPTLPADDPDVTVVDCVLPEVCSANATLQVAETDVGLWPEQPTADMLTFWSKNDSSLASH